MDSDTIYSCSNPGACLGGFNSQKEYPVDCEDGYQGVLCHDCVKHAFEGGRRYMRMGDHECSLCPDPFINSMRILFVLTIVLVIIMVLILFNIRKQKESEASIVGKILTNYLHMISTSASFNIAFPKQFYEFFSPAKQIAQSTDTILSFDCFI